MLRLVSFMLMLLTLAMLAFSIPVKAQDRTRLAEIAALSGRWDLTVQSAEGTYPSWIEFRKSGRQTLVGSYVGRFGSARPIAVVEHEQGKFKFSVPAQWERRSTPVVVEGMVTGNAMTGTVTGDKGEVLSWKGVRAAALDSDRKVEFGEAMSLINGTDLKGWSAQLPNVENGWKVIDGTLTNVKPGNNLMTDQKFTDFKLQAEFRYPKGSNGGIYLRGRYEVQIEDNFGKEADSHYIGGVYGFLTPTTNASKPAGEWQTIDITLIGRRVTINLNGTTIIEKQIIPGITGGALDSSEGEPGPILLQGDHGPIEFRKLTISPGK